jgi:hypothetical protein
MITFSSDKVVEKNLKEHWNHVYLNKPEEKLGWYETDFYPILKLISETGLHMSSRILIVGAGTTSLIEKLLALGYSNLIATDISEVALNKLKEKLGNKVEYIVDDLTNPTNLKDISPVDLWIDRAVLHFFSKKKEQDVYFNLLKSEVSSNGYVVFAEYNMRGATVCSGLPVYRYNQEMLSEKLGNHFKLSENFDYTYVNPSGSERPYVYALFRKE